MRNMPKAVRYSMMRTDERGRNRRDTYNDTEIEIDARYPMQNNYEARFRDRRGREHYDNGRFAPMRSAYDDAYSTRNGGSDIGRETREGYSPEAYKPEISNVFPERIYGDDYPEVNLDTGMRRVIGFAPPSMHYTGPSRLHEMEHRSGHKERGYSSGEGVPAFNKETAYMWTKKMHNEDGSQGEHWTIEQTNAIMQQRGYKHEPAVWYAIMNAMFSDYYGVAKKYGVAGNPEFYADLANAWLNDRDAVEDKAAVYFAKIVKH